MDSSPDPVDPDDPDDPTPATTAASESDSTDDPVDGAGGADERLGDPLRFHRWMRSSTSGGILVGIALGLQQALEDHREQPAFVMEAPGEPDETDAPISLRFDPDDPTKTVAIIRRPLPDAPAGGSHPPAGDA